MKLFPHSPERAVSDAWKKVVVDSETKELKEAVRNENKIVGKLHSLYRVLTLLRSEKHIERNADHYL